MSGDLTWRDLEYEAKVKALLEERVENVDLKVLGQIF